MAGGEDLESNNHLTLLQREEMTHKRGFSVKATHLSKKYLPCIHSQNLRFIKKIYLVS